MFGKVGYGMAVELATLEIHARVSLRRILRQHRLKNNQRLQQFLPRRFRQLAHAAHQIADMPRLLRLLQHFGATNDEFFQHHQLQSRHQQRELAHIESGHGLKGFHISGERAVGIAVLDCLQIGLGDRQARAA